jgi:hypothetical protein
MAVFAVHISEDPPDEIVESLKKHYPKPDHYKLSKRMYLVRSDSIAETLAENIGIDGEGGEDSPTGVVFKLNAAYSGFENRAVWEWLSKAEKK